MLILDAQRGFTLVETAISLFIIVALITILFTISGTFSTSRNANLQGLAAKITSRRIETLRKNGFAGLSQLPPTFADQDLSKLPNFSTSQTATDFCQPPTQDCKIKLVTVQVSWTLASTPKTVKTETLIYENGLQ